MLARVVCFLDKMETGFGRLPGFAYAGIYLLLIPAFALAYWVMRKDFYHQTSQYENRIAGVQHHLEWSIAQNIQNVLIERNYGHEILNVAGRQISITSAHVRDLSVSGGRDPIVSFHLWVTIIGRMRQNGAPRDFEISFPASHIETDPNGTEGVSMITFEHPDPDDLFVALFLPPWQVPFDYSLRQNYGLPLKNDLVLDLKNWAAGMQGFPASSPGSIWRMLYLSATTITTLGLGDIVPLSDLARTMVGLEAFLGVVLMGLFLNSLASKMQRHQKSS